MTGRKRGWLIALGLAALLVSAEVGYNLWQASRACVEVTNEGFEPINNLKLTLGSSEAYAGRILPGQKVALYLDGHTAGTLLLTFSQKGNAMGNFQVPGFDPVSLNAESFKLVFKIRPNEIERFQDDADPATHFGQLMKSAWERLEKALDVSPD